MWYLVLKDGTRFAVRRGFWLGFWFDTFKIRAYRLLEAAVGIPVGSVVLIPKEEIRYVYCTPKGSA